MSFIRKIKRGDMIYYDEVENARINGKVVQKHIRYIGKDKDRATSFPIDKVHFGYIATRLMRGDLSARELLDMIEKMGHSVIGEDLESVGIRYTFKKKISEYRSITLGNLRSRDIQQVRENTQIGENIPPDSHRPFRN